MTTGSEANTASPENSALSPYTPPATPPGFVLWLSVGQLIAWGTLFYSFSLLLQPFEQDLGVRRVDASLAFSLALLCEGAAAFFIGRWIDHGHARAVMSCGSLLAALGLAAVASAQNAWQLYLGWAIIGCAMAGTLYQPAFSVLTRRFPTDFRRAIIVLTFLGGLASTVFIPLIAWLISEVGWRNALFALAALHLSIGLPIHLYWLRNEPAAAGDVHHSKRGADLQQYTHSTSFIGLALFFILFMGITTALPPHMIPLLREQGLPEYWVIALPAAIGLLQVAGRMLLYFTDRHLDIHFANRWIPLLLPASLFTLLIGSHSLVIALLFALLYGMANGMITIVKATAMATYVSHRRAASLNGLLGLPSSLARAVAPSLLAALWAVQHNYTLGLIVLTALGLLAVVAFRFAQARSNRSD